MENSMNSSFNKNKNTTVCHEQSYEESGWTAYFEDFSNAQDASYSSFNSPSLVSDAASHAAWKFLGKDSHNHPQNPKRLSFNKKTRTKEISADDDSLEDTASSPVNSPKIGYQRSPGMNLSKTEDHVYSSLGARSNSEYRLGIGSNENNEMNIHKNKEYMELYRRGLCLVPLSALVNNFA